MKTEDFKNKYPDVTRFETTFKENLSRAEEEKYVISLTTFCEEGLLRVIYGEPLYIYTSKIALQQQERMVEGAIILDDNGEEHTVLSKTPFLCGGEMCVRTMSAAGNDVYRCTFFQV